MKIKTGFVALMILLAATRESAAAAPPAKIIFAYASMVARTSFIWIAKEQGFFASQRNKGRDRWQASHSPDTYGRHYRSECQIPARDHLQARPTGRIDHPTTVPGNRG